MKAKTPQRQLDDFLGKYEPAIRKKTMEALRKMRARLPGAVQLVYDNYNALAIGFGPTERASDAIFSIAVYPRWVTLFFLDGAELPDPQRVLQGSGKVVRHVVLTSTDILDTAPIRTLMREALRRSGQTLTRRAEGKIVIKSVSAKQRPRRPRPK
jgi:hypothetical protein